MFKYTIFSVSEARLANHFSLAIPKIVVNCPILASWSYYILEQLELFLTILSFGSIDSTFSLQSTPNVHMIIFRWKHVVISLKTVLNLLSVLINLSPSIKDFVDFLKKHLGIFVFSPQ